MVGELACTAFLMLLGSIGLIQSPNDDTPPMSMPTITKIPMTTTTPVALVTLDPTGDETASPVAPPLSPVTSTPMSVAPLSLNPVTFDPVTTTPVTYTPVTASPASLAPATVSPSTPATVPITASPATSTPITASPATLAPVSASPATPAPVPITFSPITSTPITDAPATPVPVTASPATPSPMPITSNPVTEAPVSSSPAAPAPVTASPTKPVIAPTTTSPVTSNPVTDSPATPAPVTASPVTAAPVPIVPTPRPELPVYGSECSLDGVRTMTVEADFSSSANYMSFFIYCSASFAPPGIDIQGHVHPVQLQGVEEDDCYYDIFDRVFWCFTSQQKDYSHLGLVSISACCEYGNPYSRGDVIYSGHVDDISDRHEITFRASDDATEVLAGCNRQTVVINGYEVVCTFSFTIDSFSMSYKFEDEGLGF